MKQNLSNINTLEDLQAKIRLLKVSIKERELDIENRWNRLPEETFKIAVGSVVPMLLNTRALSGSWSLIKGVFNLFKANKEEHEQTGWKAKIVQSAKKVGVSALLKTVIGLVKK